MRQFQPDHFKKNTMHVCSQIKSDEKKKSIRQTFRSLNVSVAIKRTEMGKNADASACGTTNSNDPLPNILRSDKTNLKNTKIKI